MELGAGVGSTEPLVWLEQGAALATVGKLADQSVVTGLLCKI